MAMGLTERERIGAIQILNLLSNEEVLSLAKTVTKGQLYFPNVRDATNAIITYTSSPAELLRRKKVRREILFQYAHNESVQVMPTDEKMNLIRRIMVLWGSRNVTDEYLSLEDGDDTQTQRSAAAVQPLSTTVANCLNVTSSPLMPDVIVDAAQDFNCWRDQSLRNTDEDQAMALQFSQWFYPRLNGSALISTDFFREAFLYLCTFSNGSQSVERFNGSELVAERLTAFVSSEALIFNPNSTPQGVRGTSDPHGRRVVFVCGTVHRADCVIGLFEQQFGLVRDPTTQNNWKLQSTRLALSTSAPSEQPTLLMTQRMLTMS